jgi:integrase
MKNPNHPAEGSQIKVDPIRDLKDIQKIKKHLADNPRDLAIFTLGINTNLRASDILQITVGHVRHLNQGDHFSIREQKTGKVKSVTLNKVVHEVIRGLLNTLQDTVDTAPLFQSRKGGAALTVPYLNRLVKSWCDHFRIPGNFGSHTLRKTFGYQHRVLHGTSIPILMEMFNHSTQKQTLAYLGIQPEEIKDAYLKEI